VRLVELSETKIALAVSGGSDSMALLRMALQLYSGKSVTVLTVDHGLREGSAQEALQVAEWCAALAVPHVILKWVGPKPATGIQAKARKARYGLMTDWCLQNGFSVLLTGHQADDQDETVYMRQLRTASVKSLAGIWETRDWNGIRIVRPMLKFRRAALREYLMKQNQGWLEDPSNENEKFERVRIRKALRTKDLDFGDSAQIAQERVLLTQQNAMQWCATNFNIHDLGFVTFERTSFAKLKTEVMDFVLICLLRLCGEVHDCELKNRLSLLDWLKLPATSRRVLGGAMFMKRAHQLIVGREPGRISPDGVTMPDSGEMIWDHRFRVKSHAGVQVVAAAYGPKLPRKPDLPAFIQAGLPILMQNGEVLPFHHKIEFLRQL
jgi:tRNA(Ile)-lysidine synthase